MDCYFFHFFISNRFNSLDTLQITKYIPKTQIVIIYSIIHKNGLMNNDPYLNKPINSNIKKKKCMNIIIANKQPIYQRINIILLLPYLYRFWQFKLDWGLGRLI